MSAHARRRYAVQWRRFGRGIDDEVVKHLLHSVLGAMGVVNIDSNDALTLPMVDDLNMCDRTRNAVAHVGKATSAPVSAGAIRLSKNLREQAGITRFAIREQDQSMTIGEPLGRIR